MPTRPTAARSLTRRASRRCCGSGDGSAASASAGRPRTSRCCASSASTAGVARRARVRGRDRGLQPAARARPPPSWRSSARGGSAGRLGALVGGLAFIVPGWSSSSRWPRCSWSVPPRWVLAAGAGAGAAVAAVAVHAAAGLLPASWRRAHQAGRARRLRWAAYLSPGSSRPPPSGRGSCSSCSPAGQSNSPPALPRRPARSGPARIAVAGVRCDRRRRAVVGGLGRVQGRSAVLRRRFRDHPAHAGRRRGPLPLDDQRAVPQRCRARPDHARTRRADRRSRRLRGGRAHRRPAGLRRRVRSVVRVRAARRQPLRPTSRESRARARFSMAPAPPPSAPSPARPSASPAPSPNLGNTSSSPVHLSCCSSCAAGSFRRCLPPPRPAFS